MDGLDEAINNTFNTYIGHALLIEDKQREYVVHLV